MFAQVSTVAFEGIDAKQVDVQVLIAPGLPAFSIVGLPDKSVGESRERVRAALTAIGLGLPAKRITVNLAPADMPKEGTHYDLPIALGVMAAAGAISSEALKDFIIIGELGLDGGLGPIAGVLPAALGASSLEKGLICPAACGPEAAWASASMPIVAPAPPPQCRSSRLRISLPSQIISRARLSFRSLSRISIKARKRFPTSGTCAARRARSGLWRSRRRAHII